MTWPNTHMVGLARISLSVPGTTAPSADQWDARDSQLELEHHLGLKHLSLQAWSSGTSVTDLG